MMEVNHLNSARAQTHTHNSRVFVYNCIPISFDSLETRERKNINDNKIYIETLVDVQSKPKYNELESIFIFICILDA